MTTRVIETAERVRRGDISAVEAAQEALGRIRAADKEINAFVTVAEEAALAQAKSVDDARRAGETLGPLAGVPIAIKDAICTRGVRTTCASKILANWVPPYDATVVARLRAAGAVIVGKTNMDEFAMGSSNENSAFGPVRNPRDLERAPGGSSGGSAASVAAGMVSSSLGSDTGGSIRQPAALTGVVGIKPTYGRVSRYGLVAFASSFDQVGPIASDVRGAARVLGVLAGVDARDMTTSDVATADYEGACGKSVSGLRLGVPDEYFAEGLDAEVAASVREAIAALEADGCVVERISLPHTRHAVATYYVLANAEASSNLSRFDGVRYGLRDEGDASSPRGKLRAMYGATRDHGFGVEVKRRIILGTFVLSAGYYDAYYVKAQRVRTLIRRDFDESWSRVDAVVCPTVPTPAFRLGEKVSDPLAMYLNDVFTLPASLAGLPAVSVPCRPTKSGLPIGIQIVGRPFDETTVLSLAAACEAHAQ